MQQTVSKASNSFWSALHDFARHDRPVPAQGWDEVGPGHPFLSVCIQVPLRLPRTSVPRHCASSIGIDGVLLCLLCLAASFVAESERYTVSLYLALLCLHAVLCLNLHCLA
jgi:hypothetical protein